MLDQATALLDDPFIPLTSLGLDQNWLDSNRQDLSQLLRSSKYWSNTIEPLINSGHMEALINDRYVYPHRIGLFPGLSCMFYCGFCGRNKTAAYDRNSVDRGLDIYKDLISSAPKDHPNWRDRFRISGGQEPLTNPRIGELVAYAKQLGYRIGIYTNGYMLTPTFLSRQQGLLELDYLRISAYGYDDESYQKTTKKKQSWSVIRNNLIEWARSDETRNISLGMNWIMLPGKTQEFVRFLHELRSLQDDMGRPLDFLTVREDFSQDLVSISEYERYQLIKILRDLDMFVKEHLPDTKIDYGYALEPLTRGILSGPLKMAKHTQLDGKGIPQASVQVDVLGNVYAYHETAFLDRPGSDKFIIGNASQGIEQIVRSHLSSPARFEYLPSDTEMLDAFDHAVSLAVWAARQDKMNGINTTLWQ